jgi:tetratricopeptide (TPR) repeat protein
MDSKSALSQDLDRCSDAHDASTQAEFAKPFRPVHDRDMLSQPSDDVIRDGALEQDLLALSDLYLSTGDAAVFDKALDIALERLVVHKHAGTDVLADSLGAISDLWLHRYEHTNDQAAIDKAVTYSRQRLDLHPVDHHMRGTSLQALACLLTTLARDTSSEDIIEDALQYFKEALVLFPLSHQDYQDFLFDYTAAWSVHSKITGDRSGLNTSISLFKQLLETQKPGNLARAATLEQYASTLDDLYYATDDVSQLLQALSLYHEAMEYYSDDDAEANILFMNTGLAHWNQFEQSRNLSELDEGIRLLRRALRLSPSGVERAQVLFHLGGIFLVRYLQHRDEGILQEARLVLDEAIQIFHYDHPMSMKCHARLSECYSSWYSPHQDLDKAATLLLHAVTHSSSPPSDRLDYCWSAMEEIREALEVEDMTSVSEGVVATVAKIYQYLTELLPRVANFGRDLEDRLDSLSEADDIGIGASWHTLQLTHSDIGLALEYLEAARGIFWTQALNLRSTNLNILTSEVKKELQQLLDELEDGTYAPRVGFRSDIAKREIDRDAVTRRKKAARVDEILSGIRQQPGLERFMLGPDSASLVSAASTSIVVVLIPGETLGTSEAIILQPGVACTARRLSLGVNGEDLEEWTAALKGSQWRQRSARSLKKTRLSLAKSSLKPKASKNTHNLILSQLWSDIVKPVLDALELQVISNILALNVNH